MKRTDSMKKRRVWRWILRLGGLMAAAWALYDLVKQHHLFGS